MTKAEYSNYEQAVDGFLTRNHVKPGCHSGKYDDSPFFSWRACECCGSRLGGSRETYTFATEHNETFEADICIDCVYYLAYGRLDDTTMMEMDTEEPEGDNAPPCPECSATGEHYLCCSQSER